MINKIKSGSFLFRTNPFKETAIIIFVFAVALALRLYHLGFHDFWYDEIGTINYVKHPWYNWNAPLYYILLHFWTKLFGISEFSLRLPSAIFSFLTVVTTFILGKNLFGKKAGILASVLIGLSSFHLWYAQEARDYSMVLFLVRCPPVYSIRRFKKTCLNYGFILS